MSTITKLICIFPFLIIGTSAFSGDLEYVSDADLQKAQQLGNNIQESIENNNSSYVNTIFDIEKIYNKLELITNDFLMDN